MTASTEQLHQLLELLLTELDRKAIPMAYMQDIDRKGKAFIEQAARRAPVVPLDVIEAARKLHKAVRAKTFDMQHDDAFRPEWEKNTKDAVKVLQYLVDAAAPQPPACNPSMQPTADHFPAVGQMVAAPVQLPEYGIDTANHAGVRVRGYTEQQVRQLLAAQEQSK